MPKPCWLCSTQTKAAYYHEPSGYEIQICANCHAPDLEDEIGWLVLDYETHSTKSTESAVNYVRQWREHLQSKSTIRHDSTRSKPHSPPISTEPRTMATAPVATKDDPKDEPKAAAPAPEPKPLPPNRRKGDPQDASKPTPQRRKDDPNYNPFQETADQLRQLQAENKPLPSGMADALIRQFKMEGEPKKGEAKAQAQAK